MFCLCGRVLRVMSDTIYFKNIARIVLSHILYWGDGDDKDCVCSVALSSGNPTNVAIHSIPAVPLHLFRDPCESLEAPFAHIMHRTFRIRTTTTKAM